MEVDDFVEEVLADETDAAVDGSQGAGEECPGFGGVVGDVGVGVVEVGYCDCEWDVSINVTRLERWGRSRLDLPNQ